MLFVFRRPALQARSPSHYPHDINDKHRIRVFLRKPRVDPCRERGKHIWRGYDTAPFLMRLPRSGIVFWLKVVYLSRALIRVHSHGTLFPFGVVTTTAGQKDAVCIHTTTHERKIPVCEVSAALQDASPSLDKSARYRVVSILCLRGA